MYPVKFGTYLVLRIWSMLVNVPYAVDKNVYSSVVGYSLL